LRLVGLGTGNWGVSWLSCADTAYEARDLSNDRARTALISALAASRDDGSMPLATPPEYPRVARAKDTTLLGHGNEELFCKKTLAKHAPLPDRSSLKGYYKGIRSLTCQTRPSNVWLGRVPLLRFSTAGSPCIYRVFVTSPDLISGPYG